MEQDALSAEFQAEKEELEPETVRMPSTYPAEVIETHLRTIHGDKLSTVYMRLGRIPSLRSSIGVSLPINFY